ncbi:MAG: hydrolase, HAD-superfamily, subfamily [Mucilaginibacter sp.]|nr:hydrolase, HAD-superfamily, subfamily [Mucilaginibacter sp.]
MMKAVFLDKDGTLIPDIPYNVDPALITIQQNAFEGLTLLQHEGYMLILVSNQAGIARGYFPLNSLIAVEERLLELLKPHRIHLDAFYYCPHHINGIEDNYAVDCNCRKPRPGMLLQAASDYHIDLSASWMIGDILDDVEAGNRAGCKTILIDNGNETEWRGGDFRTPARICRSINQAAECILNKQYA